MADAGEEPVVRVGDAERRAVDDLLQRAHGEGRLSLAEYEERSATAWAARTRTELDALTADLPVAAPALPEPVAVDREDGAASWVRRAGGLLGTLVVAGAVLWGGGQLVSREDGAAVFSSRTVAVAADDDRVELGVLFGSADVVVPEGTRVVVSGTTIFGSVDCDAACSAPGPREVTVDVDGAFGSVDVLTPAEAAAEDRDDAGDDDEDDD